MRDIKIYEHDKDINTLNNKTIPNINEGLKNIRLLDLTNYLQRDGMTTVITGDSLSFNRYDYMPLPIDNAYDCPLGMMSWSFMLRDIIHRNDKFFKHGDEIQFLNLKASTITISSPTKYTSNFNGRCLNFNIADLSDVITIPYYMPVESGSGKCALYISRTSSKACRFDVYLGDTLIGNYSTAGASAKFQGNDMLVIDFDVSSYNTNQNIIIKNFTKINISDTTIDFRILGMGSKYTPVHLTGRGSMLSQFFVDNYDDRIGKYSPDFLLLIIGANDIGQNIPLTTFKTNLETIINNTRTLKPQSQILLLSPPNNTFVDDNITDSYCDIMKEVAYNNTCFYIDTLEIFKNIGDFHYDNIHFNKFGNEVLLANVLKTICPTMQVNTEYMKSNVLYYSGFHKLDVNRNKHGFLYIKYNPSSGGYDIVQQTDTRFSDIISVVKLNSYSIKIAFKINARLVYPEDFIKIRTPCQFGASINLIICRIGALSAKNEVIIYLHKADGTMVTNSDIDNNPNDFGFYIEY